MHKTPRRLTGGQSLHSVWKYRTTSNATWCWWYELVNLALWEKTSRWNSLACGRWWCIIFSIGTSSQHPKNVLSTSFWPQQEAPGLKLRSAKHIFPPSRLFSFFSLCLPLTIHQDVTPLKTSSVSEVCLGFHSRAYRHQDGCTKHQMPRSIVLVWQLYCC